MASHAEWARYYTLMMDAFETQADAYDLQYAAAAAEPNRTPEERAANLAHFRSMAESARRNAEVYRRLAADDTRLAAEAS